MKILKWFPLIILVIMQWGCSSNQFLTLKDSPDCTTTIEGSFTTPKVYKFPAPVILFNKGNKYSYSMGAVVNQNKDGVFHGRKIL